MVDDGEAAVVSQNVSLFACLDQCDQCSNATDSLDYLQGWLGQTAEEGVISTTVYGDINNGRLLSTFWQHLSSDNKLIKAKARSCLEATLELLEKYLDEQPSTSATTTSSTAVSSGKRAKKVRRTAPTPEPPLLSNLVRRSIDYIERKISLVALELLQSRYGIGYLLGKERNLYLLLFRTSLLSNDGSKRAKLAISVLEHQSNELGVNAKDSKEEVLVKARLAWLELWIPIICSEMENDEDKKLHCLVAYHLPPLLEMAPWSLVSLLNLLSQSTSLMTLLAVLKCAKELDLCRVGEKCSGSEQILLGDTNSTSSILSTKTIVIPSSFMASLLSSSSPQAHSAALSILVESKSPTSPLSEEEVRLAQLHMTYNFSQSNSDLRQTTLVKLNKMLLRFRALSHVANHTLLKAKERKLEDVATTEIATGVILERAKSFVHWVFQRACQATHPGAPYHVTRTGLNLLEMLLVTGVDPNYTAPDRKMGRSKSSLSAGHTWPFSISLISPWLVNRLMECHGSTFFDIQATAREMLLCLPAPLPAHDQRDLADSILRRAKQLMLSPRESQSEAGASLSSLYLEVYVQRTGWTWTPISTRRSGQDHQEYTDRHLLFLYDHLCFLHELLDASDGDAAQASSQRRPLHGTLITLQHLFSSVDLANVPVVEMRRLKDQIIAAVDRTWEVTRGILCNSAPEGSMSGESDHEMARALEEAGPDDLDADGMQDQIFGSTPKYQLLLTYSWRGMKEASALLGVVVTKTLSKGPEKSQAIWTSEELQGVGDRFNMWLSLVRHRGAFSTIYPAYSAASASLLGSKWHQVDHLPSAWLSSFLTKVASAEASISTTRRSAGIGYGVLALLSSFPRDSMPIVLNNTMGRLINVVEKSPSLPCQIHALNILRVIVNDASLAESLESSIGSLFKLVIPRFTSESWHIRNASMMLFTELSIRAFGRSINREELSFKVDWHDFFTRFPGLDTVFHDQLNQHTLNPTSDVHQSSLFAVLLVLSKLQVYVMIEEEKEKEAGAIPPTKFAKVIEGCLQSPIWKLREIAALSLAATTASAHSVSVCRDLIKNCDDKIQNGMHGRFLAIQRIILNLDYDVHKALLGEIQDLLLSMHSLATKAGQSRATQIVSLELAIHLKTTAHLPSVSEIHEYCLDLLQKDSKAETRQSMLYGQLMATAARLCLLYDKSVLDLLIKHPSKYVRREAVSFIAQADDKGAFTTLYSNVLDILVDKQEQVTTRLAAARLLDDIRCPLQGQKLLEASQLIYDLALVGKGSVYRDQCLPCLSRMLAALHHESDVTAEVYNRLLVGLLLAIVGASKPEQPVESRSAAVRAVNGLEYLLFPARPYPVDFDPSTASLTFNARLAMLDLLEDDDEEVRLEAAEAIKVIARSDMHESSNTATTTMMISGKAQSLPRSSSASVIALWEWMDSFYTSMQSSLWQERVWNTLMPSEINQQKHDDPSLFAEEKANQYVDDLDELGRCYEYCKTKGLAGKMSNEGDLERVSSEASEVKRDQSEDSFEAAAGPRNLSSTYVHLQRLEWSLELLRSVNV